MLAMHNQFYKNPEAHARQMLQQQILMDTQKNYNLYLMELLTLRALLSHGQICLCIPLTTLDPMSVPHQPIPYPVTQVNCQFPQQQMPPSTSRPKLNQGGEVTNEPQITKETNLRVRRKTEPETRGRSTGEDECKFGPDSVEIKLDLQRILPADVSVTVGETSIRVEATHTDRDGTKSYWKQYELPACIVPDAAKCLLSHDGFLHVTVPWHVME